MQNGKQDIKGTVAIVGLGIYSYEIALRLLSLGLEIYIFEKFGSAAQGNTGMFGIRSHGGPHYTLSLATRIACREDFLRFFEAHPELIIPHAYAHYILGITDADNNPSKVTPEAFKKVCEESTGCEQLDLTKFGYQHASIGFNITEPSYYVGEKLRERITRDLEHEHVHIQYNRSITKIENNTLFTDDGASYSFDYVVNATGYQALIPPSIPFDIEIIYQPCFALKYEDLTPGEKPFSMIYMDGWYPCIMPQVGNEKENTYIVTHGKYTILGSFHSVTDANALLHTVYADNSYILHYAKPKIEKHLEQLWPKFKTRFKYLGYDGKVVAKPRCNTEFRGAITFRDDNGVFHYIPGKISNSVRVADEIASMIFFPNDAIKVKGFSYAKGGVLDHSLNEISTKPQNIKMSTCDLHPYRDYFSDQQKANEKAVNRALLFSKQALPHEAQIRQSQGDFGRIQSKL